MCTSKGCLKAACSIIKNMDPCIDPCENFYNFACGNFIKNANIPDDKGTINVPHFIGDTLDVKLRELLESDENNLTAFQLAKHLYKTCMDTGKNWHMNFWSEFITFFDRKDRKIFCEYSKNIFKETRRLACD